MDRTRTVSVTRESGGQPSDVPPASAGSASSAPAGAAAEAVEAEEAAARAAYEQSLVKAFGGRRGLLDLGLPGLLFVVVYTPSHNLAISSWSSIGLALVFAVVRLVRRETLQHVVSGLLFVVVCAYLARHTGSAKNFFLPDVVINSVFLPIFALTALIGWPIVGLMLGPITGENLMWRQVAARRRAFTLSTWIMAGVFAVRLVAEVPLYLANQVTALGIVHTVLAYPLYGAAVYCCWQIIRKAPPPVRQG